MTKSQRIALQADWWPAACRAQGWSTNDRDLRLRVCAWCVSLVNPSQAELLAAIQSDLQPDRQLKSTNDLDAREDIDRVKACLGMLADDLQKTAEVGHPEIGSARRKRDVIRDHLKCLALYEPHPRRFLASLVNDMFNHGQPGVTIKDLTDDPHIRAGGKESPSDLKRLVMRLAQIVNDKRNVNLFAPAWMHLEQAEPLTGHTMKTIAGARCDCAECRARQTFAHWSPEGPENWQDFDPELEPLNAADPDLGYDAGEALPSEF